MPQSSTSRDSRWRLVLSSLQLRTLAKQGSKDFDLAMRKVEEAVGDSKDRNAAFICVLSLAWPDGHVESFEGRVDGALEFPPRGDKGFGYDPIFVPGGYDVTFAEMEPSKKHDISHRADAFAKLVRRCFQDQAA